MEIYEALKTDHEALRESLSELLSLSDNDEYRFVLIEEIRNLLVPHSRAEEAVFYNTLRAVNAAKGVIRHGYKEHLESESLLRTLQAMDKMDLNWKPTARKLFDSVLHHVADEESEIFDEARAVLTSEEAIDMAKVFQELKARLGQEGIIKNTMDMVINMMPPRLADKIRKISLGPQQSA